MKVYALLGGYDYEGYELLGVYASRDEAVAACDVLRKVDHFDSYVVETRELGAVAGSISPDEYEILE